jgi:alpha-glucuronidase
VACAAAACSARTIFRGAPGWYAIRVQYFDLNTGIAHFRVFIGTQLVDEWAAADHLPVRKVDGGSSVRRTISAVALRPGDAIRIEGMPNGGDPAALDYIEIIK